MEMTSLIVIGSGLAGYSLIKEFRQLNSTAKIMLITSDRGDYYSKPQLSTALAAGRDTAQLIMNTAAEMAKKFNITILTHTTVTHIHGMTKTVAWHGGEQHYDQLVLALGAEAIHPLLVGDARDTITAVNTLEDYDYFRCWLTGKEKIVFLGSGLVGCELANDLIQTNYAVDIISLDTYPLARFVPEKIGHVLQEALTAVGVRWHLGCCAIGVQKKDSHFLVQLNNGESIEADGIFSAVGLRARTRLAEQAGLAVSQGIVVDHYLKTSDPHIYALGDCADVNGVMLQYIAPLLACARALAKTLSGTPTAVHYPPMPIIVKTPACALSALPPPTGIEGSWVFEGDGADVDARFYDAHAQLRGFALTGNRVKQRATLLKAVIAY